MYSAAKQLDIPVKRLLADEIMDKVMRMPSKLDEESGGNQYAREQAAGIGAFLI
jgi:hypothetical protein